MTRSLPLPSRFFKCPALSAREEQYLVAKAKESAKALVDATRSNDGPVRWADNGTHRGVQMYKGEARHPESVVGDAITYGCGATSLQGSLEEVAAFFDLSTDDKVRDFTHFNGDMLDMQLLYALSDPALLGNGEGQKNSMAGGQATLLGAHQVTVKWFVIELPSKMIKNRDFLTLECQSSFIDVSGRRGWVRSYHSIKLPSCPDMQAELGLVRGSFYHTGHVFIESERPGFLDVIFSAQVNLKGNLHLPAPLLAIATKKRLSSVADLQKMLTRRRLGAQRFLGDLELVPKNQRKHCHLCSTKFGMLTRKARCRKCGEVVCASACSTVWEVNVPRFGPRKVRVCARCAQSTDPNALEELQYGSEDSASVTQDDESVMSSRAAGGYQYGQYDPSETSSPSVHSMQQTPTRGNAFGRTNSGNGGRHLNGYGRQQSAPQPQIQQMQPQRMQPRRGRIPSGEDGYSQHSGQFGHGDYPYTTSAASAPSYHNPNEYESAGQGYGDMPSPQYGSYDNYDEYGHPPAPAPPVPEPRYQPRYEPRYQDDYDTNGFREERAPPPSAFRQQRALQQQQRALQQQQQQQHQQMVQRQQQQQELAQRQQQQELMRQQQQRRAPTGTAQPPAQLHQLRPKVERQRSVHSGASSGDELDDGEPQQTPRQAALTSSLLAQHTRQMGRPGPVTRPGRYMAPQGARRRPAEPQPAPTPTPSYPTLTRQQYIEQQRREVQQSFYNGQAPPAPAPPASYRPQELQAPPTYAQTALQGAKKTSASGSVASSKPPYQRSVGSAHSGQDARSQGRSAGASGSGSGSGAMAREDASLGAKAQTATTPGQRTLSVTDDEDCDHVEDPAASGALSPVTRALADNFSTLLRPEELRSTVDSYRFSTTSSTMDPAPSFCDSIDDYSALDDSRVGAAAQAKAKAKKPDRVAESKSTIVQLYQQILELTKKQHLLEAQPEADPHEKDAVATELQSLYQKLNQITQDPEVEL